MLSKKEALAKYEVVIGLEVHAQLETKSKLFTSVENTFDPDHPNAHAGAYCFGLPGVLPVLNQEAVALAVRAGVALGCEINERSVFARKQYFYPDLPKGYQISQYEHPICGAGLVEFHNEDSLREVQLERIHLEEDAGKNTHVLGTARSLVDFNRAGVPLIEIVSKPDLRSPSDAAEYLRALRSILVSLEVCSGNMEMGAFRCDANVSLRPRGTEPLGTRAEVKNLNSFRFVEQAIDYEIRRQATALEAGENLVQETRLFDSQKKETRSMRSKEEAHDYRYFPDPDLPEVVVDPAWVEKIRAGLPELPRAKHARYTAELGISDDSARIILGEPAMIKLFDAATNVYPRGATTLCNLLTGEVARILKEQPELPIGDRLQGEDFAELARKRDADAISSSQAKKALAATLIEGADLRKQLAAAGSQVSDRAVLIPLVEGVLAEDPDNVAKYRAGKKNVINAFLGKVMKQTKGKAKPALVRHLLEERLETDA